MTTRLVPVVGYNFKERAIKLLEYMSTCSKLAFLIGYKQQQKRMLTMEQLRKKIGYAERNAYFEMVWSSYKSGLYAKSIGD